MAKKPAGQKKKWWKIPLGIVLVLVCLYLLLLGTNYGFSLSLRHYISTFEPVAYDGDRVIPVYDDALGHYTVTTDRDLKIMMLTDLHIGGGCWSSKNDRKTVYEVITMLQAEKPDIVVLCGDNTFAVPGPMFNGGGTLNNNMAAKDVIALFEHEGVYFTTVFGNHDTEAFSYFNRDEIDKVYTQAAKDSKYCLYQSGPDTVDGKGNQIIKVKNAAGTITTQALVTLDSHSYTDGDIFGALWKYDNLHENQVNWYASKIDAINAANCAVDPTCAPVKSLAFFHIPLEEYRNAYKEYLDNGKKDTEHVTYVYGNNGEIGTNLNALSDASGTYGIYCGMYTDELFEIGAQKGLQGVFCGHDHKNNFSLLYKIDDMTEPIRLTYGMSVDYLAYSGIFKERSQRGCTVITVKPDGSFDCYASNYYENYNAKDYITEHPEDEEIK